MPRKQPLNNRINKEAMFKKIMPSASAESLSIEDTVSSSSEGKRSKKSLGDDLIDLTVSSLEDGLIGLPSQRRVIATPAAPTAPVPPPPTIRIPSIRPPRKALQNAYQNEEPSVSPSDNQPQLQPEPSLSAEKKIGTPAEASGQSETAASFGVQPEVPGQAAEASSPYWPAQPVQPVWDYPAGHQPQEVPFYPVQPYPGAQYPMGYYPYPPYPYPPYAQQPPETAAPEASQDSGMPAIKESSSTTVVADSASVVTDTVIIQGNSTSGTAASVPSPAPAQEAIQPGISQAAEEDTKPEEDIPAPHPFQAEMDEGEKRTAFGSENALPPLSEENGQVVNMIEQIAAPWIEEAATRLHGCRCEKCLNAIASLALNRLAPCYMLPEEVTEEALSNRRRVSETVQAVYAAAFQVKNAPPH